jgi:transcriptional regulator with XRE-family HTH domain
MAGMPRSGGNGRKVVRLAHAIDAHTGYRVRVGRTLLGMSQANLGAKLGVTFQQIQKYERGTNRISAGMLHRLSGILGVPITFFFDGYETEEQSDQPGSISGDAKNAVGKDLETARELLTLVRSYMSLRDPELRKQVRELVSALAKSHGGSEE